MSNKNILLTGATGFLGSHLLRAFIKKGWTVSIIKRSFSKTDRIQDILSTIDFLDIDAKPLHSIFEKSGPFDAIVHTATCYGRHNESSTDIIISNLSFPLKLIETATIFNATTFFNTSTTLHPYLNAYALSKRQFEEWGKFFSDQGKTRFVNLKLEHMYGPGDDKSKFTTFIFENLKNNVPIIELTLGEQKRDFIYIDDVVSAYVLLLENLKFVHQFSEYDIGSGIPTTIRSFVQLAKEISGSESKLSFGTIPYRDNEIMLSNAKIEPLKQFGWRPTISLKDGISKSFYG